MVTTRRLMLLVRPEEEHDLLEDPCTAVWHAEWRDILAVEMHRLLDVIRRAGESRQMVANAA